MADQMEFPWRPPLSEGLSPGESPPPDPSYLPAPPAASPDNRAEIYAASVALANELQHRTGMRLSVRVTDNSSTLLSVRHEVAGRSARLSLHHLFLDAPEEVLKALAHWIKHPKSKAQGPVLDAYIRSQRHKVRPKTRRRITLVTQGLVYDLKMLYAEVNAAHFSNRIKAWITWGRESGRRRRRSIRFGSYAPPENLIRIHPLLDQAFVPRFFVRYIVFHEMLHADLGIEETASGRRRIHPPQFKLLEETYPDYEHAVAWMENPRNLERLWKP
jgi:predicted metal-dependent hydrolase